MKVQSSDKAGKKVYLCKVCKEFYYMIDFNPAINVCNTCIKPYLDKVEKIYNFQTIRKWRVTKQND